LEESTKKFKTSNRKKQRQTSSRLNNFQSHPKASPWRASHGRNIWCRSCSFK